MDPKDLLRDDPVTWFRREHGYPTEKIPAYFLRRTKKPPHKVYPEPGDEFVVIWFRDSLGEKVTKTVRAENLERRPEVFSE
jgi:hypothetical protein